MPAINQGNVIIKKVIAFQRKFARKFSSNLKRAFNACAPLCSLKSKIKPLFLNSLLRKWESFAFFLLSEVSGGAKDAFEAPKTPVPLFSSYEETIFGSSWGTCDLRARKMSWVINAEITRELRNWGSDSGIMSLGTMLIIAAKLDVGNGLDFHPGIF